MRTNPESQYASDGGNDLQTDRSARQIHEDIRHTRHEMDETLDELGEKLHPRHLLDDFLDLFRGSGNSERGHQAAEACRRAGRASAEAIRQHPVPAALIAAGVAWWIFDDTTSNDGADWSSLSDGRASEGGVQWRQEHMPWHTGYQWHDETEESWSERAKHTLEDVRTKLGEQGASAQEKLRHAAGKIFALSGHKQKEIHARWANLREHSGSFVDARTGKPYDSSYGKEWENLMAMDAISHGRVAADESGESYAAKAQETVGQLQNALSSAGGSAKETLQRMSAAIGDYGRSMGSTIRDYGTSISQTASEWSHAAGERLTAAGEATSRAAHSMASRTREGTAAAQQQMLRGYETARQKTADAVDQYPLAVGAACFGLGLLGGLLLPRTDYEDEVMGEASDEIKSQVQSAGEEAYERGKEVASATAAAALKEAERQGLTPEKIGEHAREVIAEARESVKEAVPQAKEAAGNVRKSVESVAAKAGETARKETKEKTKM